MRAGKLNFHSFNEHQVRFRTIRSNSNPNYDISWFLSFKMTPDTFGVVSLWSDVNPILVAVYHGPQSENHLLRPNEDCRWYAVSPIFSSLCQTVFAWKLLRAAVIVGSCMVLAKSSFATYPKNQTLAIFPVIFHGFLVNLFLTASITDTNWMVSSWNCIW